MKKDDKWQINHPVSNVLLGFQIWKHNYTLQMACLVFIMISKTSQIASLWHHLKRRKSFCLNYKEKEMNYYFIIKYYYWNQRCLLSVSHWYFFSVYAFSLFSSFSLQSTFLVLIESVWSNKFHFTMRILKNEVSPICLSLDATICHV